MISAIILAAGQASRFGQCKQLVPLDGKPLLEHVLHYVNASRVDGVVAILGAHAEEIVKQVNFGRATVVVNPDYTQGLSTSIQAGLHALSAETEAAMIVLADQPFVATRTLDLLLDEFRRSRRSIVLPTYNGVRGNPVIVEKALFAEMMAIGGDIGLRAVFGDYADAICSVPVDDRGVITDIDTMEEFDRARFTRLPMA